MNHGVWGLWMTGRPDFIIAAQVPSYFSGYIMIYLGPCPNFWGLKFPWLWLTVRHGIDGPNRNRWFTELENSVIFHGELLVITRWYILWHPSNWGNTLDMIPGSSYWTSLEMSAWIGTGIRRGLCSKSTLCFSAQCSDGGKSCLALRHIFV